MPKTIDRLKQFIQEEWVSVPKLLLKMLYLKYIAQLKKIIELKWATLEPEHIKQLRIIKRRKIYMEKNTEI